MDTTARIQASDAYSMAAQALDLARSTLSGAITVSLQANVDLWDGALVNLFAVGAATKMRLADASYPDRPAHGFVPNAVLAGQSGNFLRMGTNASAGFTQFLPDLWLSDTVPGTAQTAPPTAAGHVVQHVGIATPEGGMIVDIKPAILL